MPWADALEGCLWRLRHHQAEGEDKEKGRFAPDRLALQVPFHHLTGRLHPGFNKTGAQERNLALYIRKIS